MITLGRLMVIPILASFLILLPGVGWILYAVVMVCWACKYHEDIIAWLSDQKYQKSEMSDETREGLV